MYQYCTSTSPVPRPLVVVWEWDSILTCLVICTGALHRLWRWFSRESLNAWGQREEKEGGGVVTDECNKVSSVTGGRREEVGEEGEEEGEEKSRRGEEEKEGEREKRGKGGRGDTEEGSDSPHVYLRGVLQRRTGPCSALSAQQSSWSPCLS